MKKLRTGDPIIVVAGKHKGSISVIEKLDGDKVWLKDVNVVKKAKKGEGFIKKTLPITISNVMYYLKDQKQATRIGINITKDGKRQRLAKKTGDEIK